MDNWVKGALYTFNFALIYIFALMKIIWSKVCEHLTLTPIQYVVLL